MPSLAVRTRQWIAWGLAVHEYIHTLEHPAFSAANPDNPVLTEGFCEYFTRQVLTARLPSAPTDPALIEQVEGGLWIPPTTAAMTGTYQVPADYADNVAHADAIA